MRWIFFVFLYTTLWCFSPEYLKDMSLEEKVGQVLLVHFHGETVNEDAKTLIQDLKVGGIIYYNWANGLTSPLQVRNLSCSLQTLTTANRFDIPLFIAVDQEGGVVARLQAGFTNFPGNRSTGETHNPDLAEVTAQAIARELQAVGVTMNLAPVVDVNDNPKNPIIGVRSFGNTPETVIAFGQSFLEGCRKEQMIATLKHFPGHGSVSIDSHKDLPLLLKSKEELEHTELLPFEKLAPTADAIMTAHILAPALDPDHCATLSKKTLEYLRKDIGFQGVIVSDSLVMEGVLKQCRTVDEAAICALEAGCDLLILGGRLLSGGNVEYELTVQDIQRIHGSIVDAVRCGRIPLTRLDEAVLRILQLKKQYPPKKEALCEQDILQQHKALAEKIASLALRVKKNKVNIPSLHDKAVCIIAPNILETTLHATTLFQIGQSTRSFFFNGLNPSENEIKAIKNQTEEADVFIVCSYNSWKNPSAIALITSLINKEKPVILITVRDPLDSELFSNADLIFTTFSPTTPALQAVCDHLMKRYTKRI